MGISASEPLSHSVIRQYADAYRALRSVATLDERLWLVFQDKGWSLEVDTPTDGDDDVMDALSTCVNVTRPGESGWWAPFGGVVNYTIQPVDQDEPEPHEGPTVWAGVSFEEVNLAPFVAIDWSDQAERTDLRTYFDSDSRLYYLAAVVVLEDLIDDDALAADQAGRVAEWIEASIAAVEQLGAPRSG